MRGVSRRLAVITLLFVLSAQGAVISPNVMTDDWRGARSTRSTQSARSVRVRRSFSHSAWLVPGAIRLLDHVCAPFPAMKTHGRDGYSDHSYLVGTAGNALCL